MQQNVHGRQKHGKQPNCHSISLDWEGAFLYSLFFQAVEQHSPEANQSGHSQLHAWQKMSLFSNLAIMGFTDTSKVCKSEVVRVWQEIGSQRLSFEILGKFKKGSC